MEVKNFRPINKGSLVGYIDIFLPKLDWTICGCGYFVSGDKKWVNLPTRGYKDEEGKQCYADIISMPKEMKKRFSDDALKAYAEFSASQSKVVELAPDFGDCPF